MIQVAFGWEDYHLHGFRVGKRKYEVPDPEDLYKSKSLDERRVKLNKIVHEVGSEFGYQYDFGDNWNHRLLLEAIAMPETGVHYPRCTGGARSGPPEDAGGPHGYANYVDALGDPNHKRYDEMLGWRGPFDPEAFDMEEINSHLQKDLGSRVRRRSAE